MRTRTAFLCAVAALAGCGDIIGLDGYTDGADSSVDVTTSDTGTSDANNDVKIDVTTDTGTVDAGPDVTCAAETSVCVPDLPTGWAWAAYTPDTRPACATGYATPNDVLEGIDAAAASCTCGCTTTNPSCATGSLTITAGTNTGCNNVTSQTDPADAGCNDPTQFTTTAASISVTGPTPSGGSCGAAPSQTVGSVGYDHQGRTCAYAATTTGGCASGNVCVLNPAPFNVCIEQNGTNACPTDFPTQHLIGSTINDTRGCTTCGCTFDAGACTGTATFYTNTGCSTGAQKVTVNGTCQSVGNHLWKGYSYVPTTTATCAGTSVSPDGGVIFTDLKTVCCK